MNSSRFNELLALTMVSRTGSFIAAGRALEHHPSVVSKRIATLEQRLGTRLIERTTRQVRMTDAGNRLAQQFATAIDLIETAEHSASDSSLSLHGSLRIALPAALGRQMLAPLLPKFLKRYPELHVDFNFSDRFVDLVAEGFDAAIRIGSLPDSRLVAQRLGQHRRILCASPEYLNHHGIPETPEELAEHNCLEFESLATFPNWHLSDGSQRRSIAARGSFRSNDSVALLEAARAGVGILGVSEWLAADDIRNRILVHVLPSWSIDADGGIYLVRPSAQHGNARTDAFLSWIREEFRDLVA